MGNLRVLQATHRLMHRLASVLLMVALAHGMDGELAQSLEGEDVAQSNAVMPGALGMAHNGANSEYVPANPDDPSLNLPPAPPPPPPMVYAPNGAVDDVQKAKAFAAILKATGSKRIANQLTTRGQQVDGTAVWEVNVDDKTWIDYDLQSHAFNSPMETSREASEATLLGDSKWEATLLGDSQNMWRKGDLAIDTVGDSENGEKEVHAPSQHHDFAPNMEYHNQAKKQAAEQRITALITPPFPPNGSMDAKQAGAEKVEKTQAAVIAKSLTSHGANILKVDIDRQEYIDYDLNVHSFPKVTLEPGSPQFDKIYGKGAAGWNGPAPLRV